MAVSKAAALLNAIQEINVEEPRMSLIPATVWQSELTVYMA